MATVWFVLSLGLAVVVSIAQPRTMEIVCSTPGAAKWVLQTDAGTQDLDFFHLDCPLCLGQYSAPPWADQGWRARFDCLASNLEPAAVVRLVMDTAAAAWARGPPRA